MSEKLIIDFDGILGSAAYPVYPLTNISVDDYIKFEFGTAD